MKRLTTTLLLFLLGWVAATTVQAGDIHVSPVGDDRHDGTAAHPLRTPHQALRMAREWRRTGDSRCQGGITITLAAGRYYMSEPLLIRPEDSGTVESPTIFTGTGILCGDPCQQHVQVWPKGGGMAPLTDFNPKERTITIATPPKSVLRTKNLEMVVHQRWAIAILRVRALRVEGDKTIVTFQEPESRLEFEHPWPQPVIGGERGNSSFLLRTTEQRDGIEQLVIIDGASHITFQGLTFENTCWNRPLHKGHVTLQGGFPLLDAYKLKENEGLPWDSGLENQAWVERPVSAISIKNGNHIDFYRCTFQNLAATALDYVEDISDCQVTDCRFEHIGGTAVMAGSFAEMPREVHRPYGNLAERCQRLKIQHNTISEGSSEDWGAVAIALGYVRDCTVSDNHVSHVNYSGICVGWGWTPLYTGMENNHIANNHVEDYARQLYDAGGIYTLSNQPRSSITGNVISQPFPAPYATNNRAFCIYLDARTDGFTIANNQTDGRLIRRDEIGDNQPGPNLIFK